ncbi:MAG: Serine/threonine-protein kinase PknD [bacterium]|nr:Serine/threonine-protein kinase PknD [bacterium]
MKTTIKTCTYCNSPYDTAVTHLCASAKTADASFDLPQPSLGMVIDKKYRLENKLGEGGMGSVFRARRLFIDDFIAIKFVRPEVVTNPEFRERFYQEAKVAARIKHPNVVTVYDFGETPDGMLYLVMEFLEGMSLGEMLKKKGALPLEQVIEIGLQIGEALYYMHENNVIHRDLKPDNIMLIQDGKGGEVVKVVDFGVAKILEANTRLTRYQARIGSPVYCSPEQYLGQPVDHRSDLYGLGIVFYECLSGHVPFDAVSEAELRAAILHKMPLRLDTKAVPVTGHMADLVQWLLAKDPNDRPHTAAEVNKCLHALRRGQKVPRMAPEKKSPSTPLAANGATEKTKAMAANGIAINHSVVLPILETDNITTRKKSTGKKEEVQAPRFQARPERQRREARPPAKSRKAARLRRVIVGLVLIIFTALPIWKFSPYPISPTLFSEAWQAFSAQVKNLTAWSGITSPERPATGKVASAPARPAETSPPGITKASVQPPAALNNTAESAPPGLTSKTPAPANASRLPTATAGKGAETRRNNSGREESKAKNKLPAENRARVTPDVRIENPPKVLFPLPEGMVSVKGMEFKRGDLFGDGNTNEKPTHPVRVGDFLIGQHEVTNREYLEFVKATGGNLPEWMRPDSKYHYQTGGDPFYKKLGPALYNLDHPVVGVSWQDAIMYCTWLSLKSPYKYRLPTEAEWELAARGGNNVVKYSWGNGAPLLARGGNVSDEALKKVFPDWPVIWRAYNDNYVFTAPVAKFGANAWGVYDMTGNVAEWCSDWYEENYYQKQVWDQPAGPAQGMEKVIRGGSWSDTPAKLRIAFRRSAPPTFRSNNLGFRVAASLP